jgi:hypothetical protein
MQDNEIFIRLLDAAGEVVDYSTPQEIFAALGADIAGYGKINYDLIGDQGIELGSGGGGVS